MRAFKGDLLELPEMRAATNVTILYWNMYVQYLWSQGYFQEDPLCWWYEIALAEAAMETMDLWVMTMIVLDEVKDSTKQLDILDLTGSKRRWVQKMLTQRNIVIRGRLNTGYHIIIASRITTGVDKLARVEEEQMICATSWRIRGPWGKPHSCNSILMYGRTNLTFIMCHWGTQG